jgi:hypothetical protein
VAAAVCNLALDDITMLCVVKPNIAVKLAKLCYKAILFNAYAYAGKVNNCHSYLHAKTVTVFYFASSSKWHLANKVNVSALLIDYLLS